MGDGKTGNLLCGHIAAESTSSTPPTPCPFRTYSSLELTLHQADRHLIYPPGGKEALDRIDPLLVEERKEMERRARQNQRRKQQQQEDDEEDVESNIMDTIPGLNISLSTPELVQQWIQERKKRWPSDKVVEKKRQEGWQDEPRNNRRRPAASQENANQTELGKRTRMERPPMKLATNASDETSSSDSDSDDDDSASDAPSEEPATRPELEDDDGPSGSKRPYLDDPATAAAPSSRPLKATPASHVPPHRRPRPRNPPRNPFEQRNLLHSLLKDEINQHVYAVAQVVRFLVRNDFLRDVEMQPGMAEEQKKRRGLVQEIDEDKTTAEGSNELPALPQVEAPLTDGALSTVASATIEESSSAPTRSLYRPPSPLLRPLTGLAWPPEPDPMIFLDPLRRSDPKPLTHPQFEVLATDAELRSLLRPITPLHPQGEAKPGLERALKTLDALPSADHRHAALELILGVSAQTPSHPHQLGPTFVDPSDQGLGRRFIGEVELFQLGLRVGSIEQGEIRQLAKRVSEIVEGPEFEVDPRGWEERDRETGGVGADAGGDDRGFEHRMEQRRRQWEKEADRRDLLRKLGIDVD